MKHIKLKQENTPVKVNFLKSVELVAAYVLHTTGLFHTTKQNIAIRSA